MAVGLTAALTLSPAAMSPLVSAPVSALLMLLVSAIVTLIAVYLSIPQALVVSDGAEGRTSSVGELFKTGWQRLWRVVLAGLLFLVVLVGPMVVLIALATIISLGVPSGSSVSSAFSILVFLGGVLYIGYVIILTLRYALVPYVAMFEPEVPVTKTLRRSSELTDDGGKLFIVKLIAMLIVVSVLISFIADAIANSSILGYILNALVSALFSAVMVMLYRNRRAVKGAAKL